MSAIPVSSDPPQHIPQVPALERSSVAAMVPGIWGLAIWGQRIDLSCTRTMDYNGQLVEHELFWSNETSFSTNNSFFFHVLISVFKALMTTVSLCDRS